MIIKHKLRSYYIRIKLIMNVKDKIQLMKYSQKAIQQKAIQQNDGIQRIRLLSIPFDFPKQLKQDEI